MSTGTWIILGIVVAIGLWGVVVYNGLVALRQRVSQANADIDVQLKQRYDLLPNLVETVKGYAAHERGTLDAVIQARNSAMAARDPASSGAAEAALGGAVRGLLALAESYPDLKANANFQALQGQIVDIENKLAAARRFFNNAVQEYNTGIEQFPAVLLAPRLGYRPATPIDLGDTRPALDKPPSVKF